MNHRIKKKHEKIFNEKIDLLRREGYIANTDKYFVTHLSLGMGDLQIVTKKGDTYICRYGYNKNQKLTFVIIKSNEFVEVRDVLGFRKAPQAVEEKKIKINPIEFNVVDSVKSSDDNDYEFCNLTDENLLVFGAKRDGKITRFLGPTWYDRGTTYSKSVEKMIDNYKEKDNEYYNKLINFIKDNNITKDDLDNSRYGNTK